MAKEFFGQKTKYIYLELVSSPSQGNDPILNEDKSDTQCNTIMYRYKISAFSNLGVGSSTCF